MFGAVWNQATNLGAGTDRNGAAAVFFAIAISTALACVCFAESNDWWKTPNGQLYFGAKPPAGSVRVYEYRSTSAPRAADRPSAQTAPPGEAADATVRDDNAFDAQAWRRRRQIEAEINAAADRLVGARGQLNKNATASTDPWYDPEDYRAWRNGKRDLENRESEAKVVVDKCKVDFEALTAEVRNYYGGVLPLAWSPTLNCRSCP